MTSAIGLITIRELLRDPQFKEYFVKVPQLPEHYTPDALPWRLLVMKQGESVWRGKRFGTYQEAFAGFKTMLPKIENAAINCPGLNFRPPLRTVKVKGKFHTEGRLKGKPVVKTLVWKPRLEADHERHEWCGYCRRPSIFVDKGLGARMLNGTRLPATRIAHRCMICGTNSELMDLRKPQNNQAWDLSRARFYA
jgi:hypothetical protein